MSSISKKDCIKCGLCCMAPDNQPVFADLDNEDLTQLKKTIGPQRVRRNIVLPSSFDVAVSCLTQKSTPAGTIKTHDVPAPKGYTATACACVFLEGELRVKVKCSIYPNRPKTCKNSVVPNDKVCRTLRAKFKKFFDNL
jgi:Fe-S-cluster containining protein